VSYQKRYWLEKFQVQAAGAASLLLAYFLLAPLLEGPDPEGPLTFLPLGGAARGLVFAGCLLLLAGLCSAVTVSSRPSGPLAASLLGAAGVALRSGPIRTLFWQRPEALPEVYFEMILELLAFGVVVILAAAVVGLVRWGWLRVRPGWMWQPWRTSVAEPASGSGLAGIDPTGLLAARFRKATPEASSGEHPRTGQGDLAASLSGAVLGLVLGLVLSLLLMRSAQRLQIVFALAGSFALAVIIADRLSPIRCGFLPLLMPIVAGVVMYVLASGSSIAHLPQAWTRVPFYGRALPMDWVTAGCGGAMLGYWVAKRSRDAKSAAELT